MKNDELDLLRTADPAANLQLRGAAQTGADQLREQILLSGRTEPGVVRERDGQRSRGFRTAAAATAMVVVAAPVAYATYDRFFAADDGTMGGLTCSDKLTVDGRDEHNRTIRGPFISGDAVADCQTYREQAGYPVIIDPVGVSFNGALHVVPAAEAARAQSEGGSPVPVAPVADPATIALLDQVNDVVDGGNSRCFEDPADAEAFVTRTIAETGAQGWSYVLGPDNRPYEDGECGIFIPLPEDNVIQFSPDRDTAVPGEKGGVVHDLRLALQEKISEQCLSLDEAAAVVETEIAGEFHHPTALIEVPGQECATVDLLVGGSMQVKLRGSN